MFFLLVLIVSFPPNNPFKAASYTSSSENTLSGLFLSVYNDLHNAEIKKMDKESFPHKIAKFLQNFIPFFLLPLRWNIILPRK